MGDLAQREKPKAPAKKRGENKNQVETGAIDTKKRSRVVINNILMS